MKDRREFFQGLRVMLKKGLENLSAFRKDLDLNETPYLAPILKFDDEHAKKTLAIFDTLIELFQSFDTEEEPGEKDDIIIAKRMHRQLRQQGDFEARNEQAKNGNFGKAYKKRMLESKAYLSFPLPPGSRFSRDKSAGGQFFGALNGNTKKAGFVSSSKRSPGEIRRRLNGDAGTHCMVLAICAHGLSLYDYVLFIMSDDIDQGTGAIDSNVMSFDETNMANKLAAIKTKANTILSEIHPVTPWGWVGKRSGAACQGPQFSLQFNSAWGPLGQRFYVPLVSQTANKTGRGGKFLIHGVNGCTLKCGGINHWAYNGFAFYWYPDVEYTLAEVNACLPPNQEFTVSRAVEEILDGAETNSYEFHESCSSLLQEFHRTIEVDGVPEWHAAQIGQVCLAEGTTQFIKLGEVAAALLVDKLLPSWPIVHPDNYVPERDGGACYIDQGIFVCPISSSTPRNDAIGHNHPVVIHGVDGCTVTTDSISHWSYYNDPRRIRFPVSDGTTLKQVNDCLAPFTSFQVRSEPILKRHKEDLVASVQPTYPRFSFRLVDQPTIKSGYNKEIIIHGDGCNLRSTGINHWRWTDGRMYIYYSNNMAAWVKISPAQGNSCEKQSLLSASQDQCLEEGLSLGGIKAPETGGLRVSDWAFTPCGCFIWDDNNVVHWSTRTSGCGSDQRAKMVCTAVSIDECLPPNKEFTISVVDTSVENDTTQLAEELVGELLQCAEDLFYTGTNVS